MKRLYLKSESLSQLFEEWGKRFSDRRNSKFKDYRRDQVYFHSRTRRLMWVGVDWTGRESGGDKTVDEAEVELTGFVDQNKEFVLYYSTVRAGQD